MLQILLLHVLELKRENTNIFSEKIFSEKPALLDVTRCFARL